MFVYIGLTDEPDRRRLEHGSPPDFFVMGPFPSEAEARAWRDRQLRDPRCLGGEEESGWGYAYWYTITPATVQSAASGVPPFPREERGARPAGRAPRPRVRLRDDD